ncbi:MAG TPA: STAS domain-containing protein [Patescibacteria group bacterium]|nr:STAS domain-containing protein [Patescibacteria group bacterium]
MTRPDVLSIAFSGEQVLRNADAAFSRLQTALAAPGPVAIDCTALTAADLSFLQILIAARRTAVATGRELSVTATAKGALHSTLCRAGIAVEDAAGFITFLAP